MGFFDLGMSDALGLGAKLLGGFMTQNAQENANAANQALQQTQMAYQHEANTHGIRWKVEDAVAAGLHPLAALGVSPASGFSASVGRQEPETGMGDALGRMGQDVSRAINATRTQQEREKAYIDAKQAQSLKSDDIDNQLKELRLALIKQQLGPPFSGKVNEKAYEQDSRGSNPASVPGTNPAVDYYEVAPGQFRPAPTQKHKEANEDNVVRERINDFEQLIGPGVSNRYFLPPPDIPLKEGHHWAWNKISMTYHQVPNPKSQDRYDDIKYYPENNIMKLR